MVHYIRTIDSIHYPLRDYHTFVALRSSCRQPAAYDNRRNEMKAALAFDEIQLNRRRQFQGTYDTERMEAVGHCMY